MNFDSFETSHFHEGDCNGLSSSLPEENNPNQEVDNNAVAPQEYQIRLAEDNAFYWDDTSSSVESFDSDLCEVTSSLDGRLYSMAFSDEESMNAGNRLTAVLSAAGALSTSPPGVRLYVFPYCSRSTSEFKRLAENTINIRRNSIGSTPDTSIYSVVFFSSTDSTDVDRIKGAVLHAMRYEKIAGSSTGCKNSTSLQGVDAAGEEFQLRGVKALGLLVTPGEYPRVMAGVNLRPTGYDSKWKWKDLTLKLSSETRINTRSENAVVNHDGEREFAHAG